MKFLIIYFVFPPGIRVIPYINTLVWVDGLRADESDKAFLSEDDHDDDDDNIPTFSSPKCLALNPRNALWDYVKCNTAKHYVCKLRCKDFLLFLALRILCYFLL